MMPFDLSTINKNVLESLPEYKKPKTYKIDNHMGNGCFLDAPGYPSYFTQSVYTSRGDSPRFGPEYVIFGRELPNDFDERQKVLEDLYIKLPIDNVRVQEWIKYLFKYFNHCYVDDSLGPQAMNADKLIIWPIPYYKLKSFHYPYDRKNNRAYHYSKNLRIKRREAIAHENNILIEKNRKICIPENHDAYRHIKRVYPDAKVEDYIKYIKTPVKAYNWYERLSKKPLPDECPGEDWRKHPVNGNWCQVCGWHK